MQAQKLRCAFALTMIGVLAGCSQSADNPYANLKDAPLVSARLHTVTLVSDSGEVVNQLEAAGYAPIAFASNYPGSIRVEAAMWNVPEATAARTAEFKSPGAGPNVRLLMMQLPARAGAASADSDAAFYRKVLGTEVPNSPLPGKLADNVRVQAWTFLVPSVVEARKRLRAAGIPVTFDPVAITTAYLGDHKTMGLRAPDGTAIELVETIAQ
jgi:hypothetical protein